MAKKAPASKKKSNRKTAKKPAAKSGSARSPSKKTTKKKTTKRATTKKSVTKKTNRKKPVTKKKVTKKVTKKKIAKKPAARKPTAQKPTTAKTPKIPLVRKPITKKPITKKPILNRPPASNPAAPGTKQDPSKPNRKGITIVKDRPGKSRPRPMKKKKKVYITPIPSLLGAKGLAGRKPLIASGPKNVLPERIEADESGKKRKSPFTKRQLDKFREVLLGKRAQLLGDLEQFEDDALQARAGGASRESQDAADQGSQSSDRSLNLDLAEADRKLIREIDDAIGRINERTYGLCAHTGKPINKERLEELPWAKYSIEAARSLERGMG